MSSQGKKGGQGSHGSITKAGKVRHDSPKNWELARKVTKPIRKGKEIVGTTTVSRNHKRKHNCPRVANKRLAHLRMSVEDGGLGREAGQWSGP